MKVYNMSARVITVKTTEIDFQFLPGINYNVPESLAKDSYFNSKIGKGIFKIASELAKVENKNEDDLAFSKKNAKTIIAEIADIYDVKLLKELSEDSRASVSKAAKAKLEEIDAMSEDDSEENEDL